MGSLLGLGLSNGGDDRGETGRAGAGDSRTDDRFGEEPPSAPRPCLPAARAARVPPRQWRTPGRGGDDGGGVDKFSARWIPARRQMVGAIRTTSATAMSPNVMIASWQGSGWILLASAAALVLGWQVRPGSGADITTLRCEYLNNPLGIDQTRPRLSWIMRSSV